MNKAYNEMKIHRILFTLIILSALTLSSCKSRSGKSSYVPPTAAHTVLVKEQVQTSNYTYFRVTEGDAEYWIAGLKMEAKPGETLYYNTSYVMEDFKSTELDKTFDTIYFIQDLSKNPATGIQMGMPAENTQMGEVNTAVQMGTPHQKQDQVINLVDPVNREKLKVVEQEIGFEDLFSNQKTYGDKLVKISGKVIKVTNAIMGTNWVHITAIEKEANNYDLTITTHESLQVGSVVTFEGKITLDKDFGSGYYYSILMEDGVIISK